MVKNRKKEIEDWYEAFRKWRRNKLESHDWEPAEDKSADVKGTLEAFSIDFQMHKNEK